MSELDTKIRRLHECWTKVQKRLRTTVPVKVQNCPLSIEKPPRTPGTTVNQFFQLLYNGKILLQSDDTTKIEAVAHLPTLIAAWKESQKVTLEKLITAEAQLTTVLAEMETEDTNEEDDA